MHWAMGVDIKNGSRTVDFLGHGGAVSTEPLSKLETLGLPLLANSSRMRYEGSLADWKSVDPNEYIDAFNLPTLPGKENQHLVYESYCNGVRIVVPALAFIRALFKPTPDVLPVLFMPTTIDMLSFVDYTSESRDVIIDHRECQRKFRAAKQGTRQRLSLDWAQTSKSARASAHSVFMHALKGAIGLTLPQGGSTLIFHGLEKDKSLFVNQAAFIAVEVSSDDSITNKGRSYIFHSMADSAREKTASARDFKVRSHACGRVDITDQEWAVVGPLLAAKRKFHTKFDQRHLLDGVLLKLATGAPWSSLNYKCGAMGNHVSAFRSWVTTGRLHVVLDHLNKVRVAPAWERHD